MPRGAAAMLAGTGFVLTVVGLALSLLPGGPKLSPVEVVPPVSGRWLGLNSPASKVPSHGTHGYAFSGVGMPANDQAIEAPAIR